MTPDEHYREAEKLLRSLHPADSEQYRANTIAEAQVHATLATIYRSTERLVDKP